MSDTVLTPRDTKVMGGFYSTKDTQGNQTLITVHSLKTDNRTLKQVLGNPGIREASADLLPEVLEPWKTMQMNPQMTNHCARCLGHWSWGQPSGVL